MQKKISMCFQILNVVLEKVFLDSMHIMINIIRLSVLET